MINIFKILSITILNINYRSFKYDSVASTLHLQLNDMLTVFPNILSN